MNEQRVPKFIPGRIQEWFLNIFEPLSKRLSGLGISSAIWTVISTILYFIGFLFILDNNTFLFGIFILLGGLFDLLEHFISGAGQNRTQLEDFTNAVFDRVSESLMFFGLMIFFTRTQSYTTASMAVLGLAGALIANYIGLKANHVGIPYNIGLFQRIERILLVAIGGILGSLILGIFLWVVTIFTVVTAFTRFYSVLTGKGQMIVESSDEQTRNSDNV